MNQTPNQQQSNLMVPYQRTFIGLSQNQNSGNDQKEQKYGTV